MVTRLQLRIPPEPRFARTVRDALMGFGSLHGVPPADLEALLFAVGEALANALEHGSSDADIRVIAEVSDLRFVATVIDRGAGIEALPGDAVPLPDALDERGRGIPIMQFFTDIFDIRRLPERGTAVTLGRYRRNQPA